jgi:signal transduction histidine kinase
VESRASLLLRDSSDLNLISIRSMNEAAFLVLGALAGGILGWWVGTRAGGRRVRQHLSGLLGALRSGRLSEAGAEPARELAPVREIRELLAKGWVPRWMAREEALRESLQRLADYLRHRVEAPLLAGLDEGDQALKDSAAAALDAVEDLEFFLEDPPVVPVLETRNLVDLMGEVTQEFVDKFTIFVRVEGSQEPLRLEVDPEPLKDAIFLLLHNAGEFGGGKPVQVTLRKEVDTVRILIRDQGPGFSADAILEGMSPFYSTAPGGLGLGLPYARLAVKAQGGDLLIRNRDEGGAEVEIVLPMKS